MAESDIAPEVIGFLRDHIDTVLELELLLLLRNAPARSFTAADLAHELKIDPVHADAQLDKFCQRGLVSCGDGPPRSYRYAPQTPAIEAIVAAVAAAYATRRVTMIGLIFSKPTLNLKTFADAFRLRPKERPDHG